MILCVRFIAMKVRYDIASFCNSFVLYGNILISPNHFLNTQIYHNHKLEIWHICIRIIYCYTTTSHTQHQQHRHRRQSPLRIHRYPKLTQRYRCKRFRHRHFPSSTSGPPSNQESRATTRSLACVMPGAVSGLPAVNNSSSSSWSG